MENLTLKNCVYIGFFQKTIKFSGTLLLIFEPMWELSLTNAKILVTEIDGLPVPWFVSEDGFHLTGQNSAFVNLQWIDDEKKAKKMCGKSVYIENKNIQISEIKTNNISWINYSLEDHFRGHIGTITGVDNYSGNLVLTVKTISGIRLIPFHSDFLVKTDQYHQTLVLKLPDGLI